MVPDVEPVGGTIAPGRVLAELEAIFQSPEFERAPVMRRLLAFLVRTTLSGGGDDLKAYVVAVDGLGRDPDFDSQSDSYPRVQVGRLRKMLDAYYAQSAPHDGVRLNIRPGSYRVHFTLNSAEGAVATPPVAAIPIPTAARAPQPALAAETPSRRLPRISPATFAAALLVIVATVGLAWWLGAAKGPAAQPAPLLEIRRVAAVGSPEAVALARRVEAMLGVALHRSWIVRVSTPDTKAPGPNAAEPTYRLVGQVNAGPGYSGRRLFLTLWDLERGEQIWSDTTQLPDDDSSIYTVVRPLVSALIRPFGVIATDQRAKRAEDDPTTYGCLLDYDRYFRERDAAMRKRVKDCVAAAVKREPMNANALAAASFLEFDFALGGGAPEAHARGAELARRAVAADPYNAEAQLADARAAFIAGQCMRGKAIADRAIRLNAYDPDILGLLGFLLYQCDDPAAGPLLETARTLDSDLPPFYTVAELLALIDMGKPDEAIRIADTVRAPGEGMSAQYELVRTIAEAARGDRAAAQRHWQRIVSLRAINTADPDRILSQYFYSPRFRAKVLRYLQQQRIVSPPAAAA